MKTKSIVFAAMFIFLFHFLSISQEEVRIEPNTKITIESGTTMDITTGNLVLESDATGDVSLIVLGSVEINNSGKTNAQHYMSGSAQAWHMLGAPISGMVINESVFEPGTNDDFYAWYEPSPGTWVNYKTSQGQSPTFASSDVNNGDNLLPAKGYLVAYNEADPTKTFSGTINTGNKTFTLKNSAKKEWTYVKGWNLMSNPYSSAIDWHVASRGAFEDNFAYAYDNAANGGTGDYVEIDGTSSGEGSRIAANQGFFVICDPSTTNNTIFTFTNTMQTHSDATFYKTQPLKIN